MLTVVEKAWVLQTSYFTYHTMRKDNFFFPKSQQNLDTGIEVSQ